ncbi:MAG TPA: gluconate 5-dehydrogenase [Syntrophomonas sp.]|jgi:gluconate 5-dehydrogenase|nr:gluconate 5-dehydrogenase [Syntrophomonas sp.]
MKVTGMFDLSGKTAIVTGGSVGLGAQMAIALAEAGADVVVAARKVERCHQLCAQLETLGVRTLAVACDVSREEDCKRLVDATVTEFTSLDILVNNAGYTWAADAMSYPIDKWEQVMNTNLTGLFQLSSLAAAVMKEQGRGKIINVTSVAGLGGTAPETQNTVAYNASKGAVMTLTRDLAVKWARYGIYVNAIAPGFFPTHMSKRLLEKNQHLVLPRVPLNRLGGEGDLKGTIVFLSSAASDYVTGQCLFVDGGITAMV